MKKHEILKRIMSVLEEQGFKINPHVRPRGESKVTFKQIQQKARLEQISYHNRFLKKYFDLAKSYCRDGKDINPDNIELELLEVKSDSLEEILFRGSG
jgi:intein-encoded DNA endonuclease-like protein